MQPSRPTDARRERLSEQRVKVRAEFVDAALRALDKVGPDASMEDIAREAGAAKPKLYRFFDDKVDLYDAIADRFVEIVWSRLLGTVNLIHDSVETLGRQAISEYVRIASEHPNAMRFLVSSYLVQAGDRLDRIAQSGRTASLRIREMLTASHTDTLSLDTRAIDFATVSVFATVSTSTDTWLRDGAADAENPMPEGEFVDLLASIVMGIVESVARRSGVRFDPTKQVHLALTPIDAPQ